MSKQKISKDFYKRLKKLLNVKNNEELSKKVNVSNATISRWYNKEYFDINLLYSIEELNNFNLNWLLTGEGEPYLDSYETDSPIKALNDNIHEYLKVNKEITEVLDQLDQNNYTIKMADEKIIKDQEEIKAMEHEITKLRAMIEEKETMINKLLGILAKTT
jgi:transcriptional regulator with XRE-family HTH domain